MTLKERLAVYTGFENPEYSEDQRRYMRGFARGAIIPLVSGFVFNIIIIALVAEHTIDFSKCGKTTAEELIDLQSRIGYVLKFSTPGLVFLLVCVHWVIHQRIRSPAMDPLYNQDVLITKSKNILQNSLEQFVLSVSAQLVMVSHLSPDDTLRYIPALSFLFILGRICFWIGYPQYRSFGMVTSMLPTLVVVVYNCVKFFDLFF